MKFSKPFVVFLICFLCISGCFGVLSGISRSKPSSGDVSSGIGDDVKEPPQNIVPDPPKKEEISLSNLSYVALGDSITYGYSYGKITPYCNYVSEFLNLEGFTNLGVGGHTLSTPGKYGSLISQLKKIPADSDIISVMAGVNDWAQGVELGTINDSDTTTVYGGLDYIARYLKIHYSNSFVFFMTVLPVGDAKHAQYDDISACEIEEINVAIKEVALKYNIPVLDTYQLAGYQNEMNNSDLTDGCHPSASFHKDNLAPLISKYIEENYKEYLSQ